MRLYAAHQAVVARVFKIKALAQHHLDVGIIKVAGREAHTRFHHVDDLLHVLLWRLVMDTAGQRRLVHFDKAHGVHDQIGQVVTSIATAAFLPADGQVDKRLVTGEVLGTQFAGHPHQFGTLDDEGLQQFQRLFLRQTARFDIGLVHRVAILIQTSQ
ncbi:hypothetical protein D3C80_1543800 [compost metagenome]